MTGTDRHDIVCLHHRLILGSVRVTCTRASERDRTVAFRGPRFPPVGQAYDRRYLSQMKQVAATHDLELREGVYSGLGIHQ